MTEPTQPTGDTPYASWYFGQGMEPPVSQMTLRDWIAGQALNYILHESYELEPRFDYHEIAAECYQIADAMIKVRGEK